MDHDFARKASAWSNYLSRGSQSASEVCLIVCLFVYSIQNLSKVLGRKHSEARLEAPSFNMPKLTVYHSSRTF